MTKNSLSVSQNGKETNEKKLKSSGSKSSNSLNKSVDNNNNNNNSSGSSGSGSSSPNSTTTTTTTTTTTSTTNNQQEQQAQAQAQAQQQQQEQQSNPSLFNVSAHYDSLCNMIIRPPRYYYTIDDLGPKAFSLGHPLKTYVRNDFELINPRGHSIQCSHFKQSEYWESGEKQPCVIYCHGNSGCRLDAMECVRTLLPMNITVLVFDFSGSGLSGGQYVTLGHFEKDDVGVIVKHLRETGKISTIGLWGRSMGAVTSILYAKEDPSIAGMVLDSPFSSLYKVAEELVHSAVQKLPKLMISLGLKMVRGSIKKRAHFDIKDLDITPIAESVFIPALFAHGESDNFVRPHHSEKLFEKYNGDKNRLLLKGGHNSERPNFFFESVSIFFTNTLKPNLENSHNTHAAIGIAYELFKNPEMLFDDCSIEEQKLLFSLYQQQQQKKKQQQQKEQSSSSESSSTTTTTTTTTSQDQQQQPKLIVTEPSLIFTDENNQPQPTIQPNQKPTAQQLQQNDFSYLINNNTNTHNNNTHNNNNSNSNGIENKIE